MKIFPVSVELTTFYPFLNPDFLLGLLLCQAVFPQKSVGFSPFLPRSPCDFTEMRVPFFVIFTNHPPV